MLVKGLKGERGWMIMNGELKGYQKVVWTYIEESVIDSILREEKIR